MDRFKQYNPNPDCNRVGDCTVRAIAKATGQDWDTVYLYLCIFGFDLKDLPSANHVWGTYLKSCGFERRVIDDRGQAVYTVEDFCRDNPQGTFILAIDGHVVCVQDGFYYDSWDSGKEIPVYYWTR